MLVGWWPTTATNWKKKEKKEQHRGRPEGAKSSSKMGERILKYNKMHFRRDLLLLTVGSSQLNPTQII